MNSPAIIERCGSYLSMDNDVVSAKLQLLARSMADLSDAIGDL